MNGCNFNSTNGCARCPARHPCELPLEEAESSHSVAHQENRADWALASAVATVLTMAILAVMYLTGVI